MEQVLLHVLASCNFPSANEVAERCCFYTCLSFCSQAGVVYTPLADTPLPGQTTPSLGRHPLPGQTPPRQTPGGCLHSSRHTPPRQTPLGRHPPPNRDGHCSRRYAFYWNAFLFTTKVPRHFNWPYKAGFIVFNFLFYFWEQVPRYLATTCSQSLTVNIYSKISFRFLRTNTLSQVNHLCHFTPEEKGANYGSEQE